MKKEYELEFSCSCPICINNKAILELILSKNKCFILKYRKKVDKNIKKILGKEKSALKDTKQLLKMDKKQDKKLDKLENKKKK